MVHIPFLELQSDMVYGPNCMAHLAIKGRHSIPPSIEGNGQVIVGSERQEEQQECASTCCNRKNEGSSEEQDSCYFWCNRTNSGPTHHPFAGLLQVSFPRTLSGWPRTQT